MIKKCYLLLLFIVPYTAFSQELPFTYNYRTNNGYSGVKRSYEFFAKNDSVCVRTSECRHIWSGDEPKDTCVVSLKCGISNEVVDSVEKMLLDADVFLWKQSYYAKDVYDGDNWSLGVQIGERQKWVDGYMDWPEKAPMWEINDLIRTLMVSDNKK